MTPAEFMAAIKSKEFKLLFSGIPFLNVPRTSQELIDEFKGNGVYLLELDYFCAALILSGLSYEESKLIMKGLTKFIYTGSSDVDFSSINGKGIGLIKVNCYNSQIRRFSSNGCGLFTIDGGQTWFQTICGPGYSFSIKSWIFRMFRRLCLNIYQSYDPSLFTHNITEWGFYEPVGAKMHLKKVYRATNLTMSQLEERCRRLYTEMTAGTGVREIELSRLMAEIILPPPNLSKIRVRLYQGTPTGGVKRKGEPIKEKDLPLKKRSRTK